MDFSGKLYVAIKAWFDNIYDLYVNPTPKNVVLQNAKVDEQGNVSDVTVPNMAMQSSNFESWKSTIETNRIFEVGGDNSHFYPVVLNTSHQPYEFFITRDSIHWDSAGYGRVYLNVKGFASHWGNEADFKKVLGYINYRNNFVADIKEEHKTGFVIVYLRGNTKYRLRSNAYCSPSNLNENGEDFTTVHGDLYPILEDNADNITLSTVAP